MKVQQIILSKVNLLLLNISEIVKVLCASDLY